MGNGAGAGEAVQQQHIPGLPPRAAQVVRLGASGEEFDVLIIGGGATGCGAALDAQMRGLRTALIERGDFASETSRRSTKLVWAGIRYIATSTAQLLQLRNLRRPQDALADFWGEFKMVLGANLKPTKGINVQSIFKPQEYEKTINSVATFQSIAHGDNMEGGVTFNNEVIKMLFKMQGAENLQRPENVGVFEKFLCKKLTTPLQRYTYLRLFQMDLYKSIFVGEFDAEVFTVIVNVLNEQVIDNLDFNNMVE